MGRLGENRRQARWALWVERAVTVDGWAGTAGRVGRNSGQAR